MGHNRALTGNKEAGKMAFGFIVKHIHEIHVEGAVRLLSKRFYPVQRQVGSIYGIGLVLVVDERQRVGNHRETSPSFVHVWLRPAGFLQFHRFLKPLFFRIVVCPRVQLCGMNARSGAEGIGCVELSFLGFVIRIKGYGCSHDFIVQLQHVLDAKE